MVEPIHDAQSVLDPCRPGGRSDRQLCTQSGGHNNLRGILAVGRCGCNHNQLHQFGQSYSTCPWLLSSKYTRNTGSSLMQDQTALQAILESGNKMWILHKSLKTASTVGPLAPFLVLKPMPSNPNVNSCISPVSSCQMIKPLSSQKDALLFTVTVEVR